MPGRRWSRPSRCRRPAGVSPAASAAPDPDGRAAGAPVERPRVPDESTGGRPPAGGSSRADVGPLGQVGAGHDHGTGVPQPGDQAGRRRPAGRAARWSRRRPGSPVTSMLSFTMTGTPWRGPRTCPRARSASRSSATPAGVGGHGGHRTQAHRAGRVVDDGGPVEQGTDEGRTGEAAVSEPVEDPGDPQTGEPGGRGMRVGPARTRGVDTAPRGVPPRRFAGMKRTCAVGGRGGPGGGPGFVVPRTATAATPGPAAVCGAPTIGAPDEWPVEPTAPSR